jgi:methyl-accepting chemotaxis protein
MNSFLKAGWSLWLIQPLLKLRIGPRLGLAFAGVFILMAAMAVFATLRLSEINNRMAHITQNNNLQIARASQMIDSVRQRAVAIRNLTMLSDPELKKAEQASIEEATKRYETAKLDLHALIARYDASEAEKALMDAIDNAEKVNGALLAQAIDLGLSGKTEEATAFVMDKVRARQARWITVLQTLSGLQAKTSDEYVADSQVAFVQARWMLWAFVAAALSLGALLALGVTRSITGPIGEAARLAQIAATGDLTVRSSARHHDETGELLDAMRAMSEHLAGVVGSVRDGSEHIAAGTAEIARGNTDLSERTERQAASLQQTAAAMEELRATVRNNSDTARTANAISEGASAAARKGGQEVSEVVQTMDAIKAASRRIGDIIGVIDGIAFQTNILALNAAVEAARAGEQGRGFAVVAGEVRNLAQRSASAAREIKSLIGASAESVERGVQLVGRAGSTMQDIVDQVARVTTLIGEISHAATEQTTGIDQVGQAVSELDHTTQQNAALVEESAAAAESLRQQAAQLLESVRVFRLEAEPA